MSRCLFSGTWWWRTVGMRSPPTGPRSNSWLRTWTVFSLWQPTRWGVHTFTHMHKHTRNHSCFPIVLGSIKPVPTLAPAHKILQDPRGKGNFKKKFLRSAYRSLDFIQAWVFKSGPLANVAQFSDGSLLDDSFHSLAVIRDIRVADWGIEICQNLSKGGDWAVEERWCQEPRSRSPFWTLEM